MAAAYALSLIKNHAFIDNFHSLSFTLRHGVVLNLKQDEFFELAIAIATSQLTFEEIADSFRKAAKKESPPQK